MLFIKKKLTYQNTSPEEREATEFLVNKVQKMFIRHKHDIAKMLISYIAFFLIIMGLVSKLAVYFFDSQFTSLINSGTIILAIGFMVVLTFKLTETSHKFESFCKAYCDEYIYVQVFLYITLKQKSTSKIRWHEQNIKQIYHRNYNNMSVVKSLLEMQYDLFTNSKKI